MWWLNLLHVHPVHLNSEPTAVAQGQTTKVVGCEACNRRFAYELKRTATAAYYGRAREKLERFLLIGIDPIPCPGCGWYQSNMIPEARRRHRRWMRYAGQCLTLGPIGPVVVGWTINAINEREGKPSIPSWIFLAGMAGLFVVGIGMIIEKYSLAQSYNPNDEGVETRNRYGQSHAVLLSEQEPRDLLGYAGDRQPEIT